MRLIALVLTVILNAGIGYAAAAAADAITNDTKNEEPAKEPADK